MKRGILLALTCAACVAISVACGSAKNNNDSASSNDKTTKAPEQSATAQTNKTSEQTVVAEPDAVMTVNGNMYEINTTSLAADVKGYNGATPLIVTIENDKVVKVTALDNEETPRFFQHMTNGGMLDSWNGKTVDEALNANVDAVAGATYSSNAVVENVHRALKYYMENKK